MSEVKVNKISPRTNCGTTQLGDAGDTITVTGDLKSNSLKSASGSTITLGQSGDTIQLGCGATQTGFGRTGTVDWDTTAKTASFTAVSGNGYFVNTTSGAITVTLPAGSAGDIVSLADYAATWQTNNVTVTPNGTDKIGGTNANATLSTEGQSVTFIYADSTQGWLNTMDSTSNVRGSSYIVATGGTITTCGDYKIHTFTGPGTFCVSQTGAGSGPNVLDYLVVAGGGATAGYITGAGGGGGFRFSKAGFCSPNPLGSPTGITASVTGYPVTVGAGGAGGPAGGNSSCGQIGSNSIFSTITSAGGGYGGGVNQVGGSGGSGGSGGGYTGPGGVGSGNTPPTSPPQGNNSGTSWPGSLGGSGGGGGAGGVGSNAAEDTGAAGGVGSYVPTALAVGCARTPGPVPAVRYFAGGGGGSAQTGPGAAGGAGGGGPGGSGPVPVQAVGTDGTANTGGGGGGNTDWGASPGVPTSAGGSGIVIIRYKYQN